MKTVSVIIPCYNCEIFINDTLESLSHQTYKDFEVVCVNDGSADRTLSILKKWQQNAAFSMQILCQPNRGVSCARNAGIQAAEGSYILFLDADDSYHPEFIEQLCHALSDSHADAAYCRLSRDPEKVAQCHPSELQAPPYILQTQDEAMHNLLYRMGEFGFYCYLYRKKVLEDFDLSFDAGTRHFEDREFNWKYLCHCSSVALVDHPLYWYRINEHSVTQRPVVEWHSDRLEAARRIENYLRTCGCPFLPELESYLFARVMWTTAKNYALGGKKELLQRLAREYDVRTCMKRTAKDKNKLVALASWLYLIHPMLFYGALRLKK